MRGNNQLLLIFSIAACYTGYTAAGEATRPRGVGPEFAKFYQDAATFTCISDPSSKIPFASVNDDYCDCPDGSDEPGTSACSFISKFSPSFRSDPGDLEANHTPALPGFYCKNKGHKPAYLPSQDVNDGKCDYEVCCDGSDEWAQVGGLKCENKCKEIGKEWRKQEDKRQKSLAAAMKKRKELAASASRLRKEVEDRIESLGVELQASEVKVKQLQGELDSVRLRDRGKVVKGKKKGKVNVLAGLAKDRVNELRTALTDVRSEKVAVQTHLTELEEILSKFKEEYNPNFNDEGVKRAVRSWEEYVARDDGAQGENSGRDKDFDEIVKPDGPESGINWEEWENVQEGAEMTLVYKIAAYMPASLVNYIEDKLAELRSFLIKNGVLVEPNDDSGESQAVKEARERLRAEESSQDELRSSLRDRKSDLEIDYGKDSVFLALKGTCISKDYGEYVYELCWMDRTVQKSRKGRSDTTMGKFDRIGSVVVDESTSSGQIIPREKIALEYTNGSSCWNGPNRSTKVVLECGEKDEIQKITEDEKCVYSMFVTTPAVCEPASSNGNTDKDRKDEL